MEELITFGGELKALDDTGRVGGYLITFSPDGKHKDLAGDYFKAESDLGPSDGNGQECLFEHGFPIIPKGKALSAATVKALEMLADRKFQPLKTRRDAIGIFAETVLDLEDEYEKFIHKRVKAGKMGWSSAASSHRVKRADDGWLMRWPISEGSITPRPCEPKHIGGVMPLKSVVDIDFMDIDDDQPSVKHVTATSFGDRIAQLISDREEDGQERTAVIKSLASAAMLRPDQIEAIIIENQRPSNAIIKAFARVLSVDYALLKDCADRGTPKTIKGLYAEELAERTPSIWELDSARNCVVRKIAEAARAASEGGGEYDWQAKITELMAEYSPGVAELINTQVASWVAGEYDGDEFYLKSGIVTDGSLVTSGLDFNEHSELVVTALTEITKRFRDNHGMRVKAGRVLSEKNRSRLAKLVDQMMASVTECQALLDETKPMASDTEKNAAYFNHARIQHRQLRAQIGV